MTLKEFLFYEGLTNKEFANMLSVSQTAVHGWVQGKAIPRPKHIRKIREVTEDKVDVWSFYSGNRTAD